MDNDPVQAEVLALLDMYIEASMRGLVTNARALEGKPADRVTGARVVAHLVDLDRLVTVRNGLHDA